MYPFRDFNYPYQILDSFSGEQYRFVRTQYICITLIGNELADRVPVGFAVHIFALCCWSVHTKACLWDWLPWRWLQHSVGLLYLLRGASAVWGIWAVCAWIGVRSTLLNGAIVPLPHPLPHPLICNVLLSSEFYGISWVFLKGWGSLPDIRSISKPSITCC